MKKTLLTICFLSLFITALAQQTPRRTGSINGRIVTEDGALVSGARVFIGAIGDRTTSPSRNIALDDDGNFTVNNLEARGYRVSASLPGYVTAGEDDPWRVARLGDTVTVMLTKGGVITGRVTNQSGEPVIGVMMQATRVKDANGKPITTVLNAGGGSMSATDDRGIYRICGLSAGSYVVATQNANMIVNGSPYAGLVPTFYPSNTREGATEVPVTPGSETGGIDLRFRNELGHSISGKVAGAVPGVAESSIVARGVSVRLTVPGTQQTLAQSFVQTGRDQFGFELKGIANGEYEISAISSQPDGASALSPPRRVTVRNADVGGVELVLASLAAISGKFVVEPAANLKPEEQALCVKGRPAALNEIVLNAQTVAARKTFQTAMGFGDTAPAEDGTFTLSSLEAGQYRLNMNLPGDGWYAKSIAPPAGKTSLALAAGEKLSGVVVTLAEGAAQMRGKWSGKPNVATGGKQRVHLVPADATLASDVLRYYEAPIQSDGTFALTHLAPGKYWLVVKAAQALIDGERLVRPLAWDATARAALRKEAEAGAQAVELGACIRLSDYKLGVTK